MNSVREEGMISKETGVPIDKYKKAKNISIIFFTLINQIKLMKLMLMIPFNLLL